MGSSAEKLETTTTTKQKGAYYFPSRRRQTSQVTGCHRSHGVILQDYFFRDRIHQFFPKWGECIQSQPGNKSPKKS